MRRFRPLTWPFLASALALVIAGFVTTGPPAPAAWAAPVDRWLLVNPICCGDSGATVGLAGAWTSGVEALLEVDRLPLDSVDLTLTQMTPANFFIASPLGVGDVVRVTSDGVTKELAIEPFTIEWILSDDDLVHGTAPEGREIQVGANPYGPDQETLTTVATGDGWTVDFTGVFDIQEQDPSMPAPPAAQVSAQMAEAGPLADGDVIGIGHNAITPIVNVMPDCCGDQALVQTSGWRLGTLLTLDVLRDTTTLLHKTVTSTGFPQLTDAGELAPLVPGDRVELSAAGLTKEVSVVELTITSVDPAADTVAGTAPAGATVLVNVIVPNPPPTFVAATADGSGQWTAFLAPIDVLPTDQVNVKIVDPERDSIAAMWSPPPQVPWLTLNPDTGLQNGQTVQVHGEGFGAGQSVLVTQCQLAYPASERLCQRDPDYVDPQSFDDVAGVWVTTDAEGMFDTEYAVTALLPTWQFTGLDDPMWMDSTFNCLESGECAIVAWQLDEQLTRAGAPITFAPWPDTGFEGRTSPPPAVNVVKARSVVSVTFTVGGDRGLDIVAAGYPQSAAIACGTNPEMTNGDPTEHFGNKALRYHEDTERYSYKWVTEKAWKGTCRQLIIQLADGSYLQANFRFR